MGCEFPVANYSFDRGRSRRRLVLGRLLSGWSFLLPEGNPWEDEFRNCRRCSRVKIVLSSWSTVLCNSRSWVCCSGVRFNDWTRGAGMICGAELASRLEDSSNSRGSCPSGPCPSGRRISRASWSRPSDLRDFVSLKPNLIPKYRIGLSSTSAHTDW